MKKKSSLIVLIFFVTLSVIEVSCSKGPGPGGQASIRGKVWVKQYDKTFSTLNYKYWGYNETVQIIYGSALSPGASVRTDYDGNFEFLYLQKGDYTVYVYSSDSAAVAGPPLNPTAPQKAIIKNVTITSTKQTLDAGTFTILKNK